MGRVLSSQLKSAAYIWKEKLSVRSPRCCCCTATRTWWLFLQCCRSVLERRLLRWWVVVPCIDESNHIWFIFFQVVASANMGQHIVKLTVWAIATLLLSVEGIRVLQMQHALWMSGKPALLKLFLNSLLNLLSSCSEYGFCGTTEG